MTNRAFPRAKRIAQQIQQTLSELIRRELRDPRLGMVTITEVRVASDLGSAKVYFSVLGAPGSENSGQQAQEILEAAAPLLRGPLGRALGIRHSPELRFVQDELIEKGAKLSALINKAVKDDAARHVDEDDNS
jgi:ribosome-binding factor A